MGKLHFVLHVNSVSLPHHVELQLQVELDRYLLSVSILQMKKISLQTVFDICRYCSMSAGRQFGRASSPSNAKATSRPKHEDAKLFENHFNPFMLVFIG